MKVLKYYKGKCGNAARVRNTKGLQLELKIGLWLELEMGLQMKWDEWEKWVLENKRISPKKIRIELSFLLQSQNVNHNNHNNLFQKNCRYM